MKYKRRWATEHVRALLFDGCAGLVFARCRGKKKEMGTDTSGILGQDFSCAGPFSQGKDRGGEAEILV